MFPLFPLFFVIFHTHSNDYSIIERHTRQHKVSFEELLKIYCVMECFYILQTFLYHFNHFFCKMYMVKFSLNITNICIYFKKIFSIKIVLNFI